MEQNTGSDNNKNMASGANTDDPWAELRTVNQNNKQPAPKKKGKGLKIFLIILAIFIAIAIIVGIMTASVTSSSFLYGKNEPSYDTGIPFIAEIDITGTIDKSSSSSIYEVSSYNQSWLINKIDDMIQEDNCEGLLLYLDTPGGSVYATDEVYLKLKEFKKKTGKPIYAAMGPTCASGGYYISCAADKAYANRNAITGSIGVTMGTSIDISQLLSDYGIKTTTLVSGPNKAMGSMYDPLTEEQIAIYQSIIDESYDQFTRIVAKGRNMDLDTVKKLADGRVYTAKQAADNGLIDGVKTYEDTIATMQKDCELEYCPVYEYSYHPSHNIYSMLLGFSEKLGIGAHDADDGDLASAIKLAESGNYGEAYYLMN